MKKVYVFAIIFFLLFVIQKAKAQTDEVRCQTFEFTEKLKQEIPGYAAQLENNEKAISEWIKNHPDYRTRGVITIPVVVHLIYNDDSANHKLSDWQITSEIDAMNEDFSRQNADAFKTPGVFASLAADCEIQFCLAKRDSEGNPTTGIIRTPTILDSFGDFSSMKHTSTGGDDGWDYKRYLNIWVCNLGNGVLGYSTLPASGMNSEDGCVIHYKAFGRINTLSKKYNRGRTGTHEVGHWFNLLHVWGDANCGNDKVDDTPVQKASNFGCPEFPHISLTPCKNEPNGDMYMNYMDYSNDSCMNIFTLGQKQRMLSVLNTSRKSIDTSTACNPVSFHPLDVGISNITQPIMMVTKDSIIPVVTLTNFGSDTITSATIYYSHNYKSKLLSYNWSGILLSGISANITLPKMKDSMGYQLFIAYTRNPNGQPDADTSNDFKTRSYYVRYSINPIAENDFYIYNPDSPDKIDMGFKRAGLIFDTLSVNDIKQFEIYNTLGQQIIFNWSVISSNGIEVDLPALPSGMYYIRVRMDKVIMDKKLLVVQTK